MKIDNRLIYNAMEFLNKNEDHWERRNGFNDEYFLDGQAPKKFYMSITEIHVSRALCKKLSDLGYLDDVTMPHEKISIGGHDVKRYNISKEGYQYYQNTRPVKSWYQPQYWFDALTGQEYVPRFWVWLLRSLGAIILILFGHYLADILHWLIALFQSK